MLHDIVHVYVILLCYATTLFFVWDGIEKISFLFVHCLVMNELWVHRAGIFGMGYHGSWEDLLDWSDYGPRDAETGRHGFAIERRGCRLALLLSTWHAPGVLEIVFFLSHLVLWPAALSLSSSPIIFLTVCWLYEHRLYLRIPCPAHVM